MQKRSTTERSGDLQDVPDKNEDPLDDHPVVLASLVELLSKQLAQVLRQHGPQLLVYEGLLVHLQGSF